MTRAIDHFRKAPLATFAMLLAHLTGCVAPTQYQGPIVVEQVGLASRFRQLCARRIIAGAHDSPCSTAQLDE